MVAGPGSSGGSQSAGEDLGDAADAGTAPKDTGGGEFRIYGSVV